ncbi:MAG: hypothetical protein ABW006_03035 [Hyphomicrobium sp.]
MSPFQESTLVEAMMSVRSQIDFLWQFFVSVHIALFALLLIYDHAVEGLNFVAKFFAIVGVAAFEWINGNALVSSYGLLDAMQEQFRWSFGQADRFHPLFYERFVLASYADRPEMVLVTHSSALFVVFLAFVSRRFIQSRTKDRRPHDSLL